MLKTKFKEITAEQYERALQHNRYIAIEDRSDVFTEAELCGYGVYNTMVYKDGDKYMVEYETGSSCD